MMRLTTRWVGFALLVALVATVACPGTAVAQLVTGNLTLYYDFEELGPGTGTMAGPEREDAFGVLFDKSGNGFNATVHVGDAANGDLTPGTFEISSDGVFGSAGSGQFNQSTDSLDWPVFADVNGKFITENHPDKLPAATNQVTYAVWVNTTKNDDGDQSLFQGRSGDAGHGNPHFQLQGSGQHRLTMRNQAGKNTVNAPHLWHDGTEDSGIPYPINEWFHVAATYDMAANEWHRYINGELVQSGVAVTDAETEGADGTLGDWGGQEEENFDFFAAGFGAVYDSGSRRFDGKMDELYVFNRALSAEEIGTLYNGVEDEGSIADLNDDGFVDGLDLGILLGEWNPQVAAAMGVSQGAVPEPTSAALVLTGVALAALRRRR